MGNRWDRFRFVKSGELHLMGAGGVLEGDAFRLNIFLFSFFSEDGVVLLGVLSLFFCLNCRKSSLL